MSLVVGRHAACFEDGCSPTQSEPTRELVVSFYLTTTTTTATVTPCRYSHLAPQEATPTYMPSFADPHMFKELSHAYITAAQQLPDQLDPQVQVGGLLAEPAGVVTTEVKVP